MTERGLDEYKQELLVNRIATALGFERLSNWLDEQSEALPRIPPSYLMFGFIIIINMGVLETYNYLIGKNTLIDNPSRIFATAGVVLAVVGVRWMHETYAQSIADLRLPERDLENDAEIKNSFENLLPLRVEVTVYLVALVLYLLNLFFLIGFSTVVEIEGIVRTLVANFVTIPIYLLLITEFGLLYFSIHLLLPRKIAQADLNMFFYDPQNMGGFGSTGQLLKRSYYIYTVGVLVYFGLVYWPEILGEIVNLKRVYPEPTAIVAVFFIILWLIGVCSIGYSMYRMHALMSKKKPGSDQGRRGGYQKQA
ncbi:MAG: hypothetical protein J07HX64_00535 [halophilic archaeon J07HX64]|nr:MAG: hypothetical protein J07HX64_00535 [halophilic archaeon J07HX64]